MNSRMFEAKTDQVAVSQFSKIDTRLFVHVDSADSLQAIKQMVEQENYKSIVFDDCKFEDTKAFEEVLKAIVAKGVVKKLQFKNCNLNTPANLDVLCRFIQSNPAKINNLDLADNNLPATAVTAIVKSSILNTNIMKLNLGGNNYINDNVLKAFAYMFNVANQTLVELRLSTNGMTESTNHYWMDMLANNKTLLRLYFDNVSQLDKALKDSFIQGLDDGLVGNTSIVIVEIDGKRHQDKKRIVAANAVKQKETFKELKEMDDVSEGIKDHGVSAFADDLRTGQLTYLQYMPTTQFKPWIGCAPLSAIRFEMEKRHNSFTCHLHFSGQTLLEVVNTDKEREIVKNHIAKHEILTKDAFVKFDNSLLEPMASPVVESPVQPMVIPAQPVIAVSPMPSPILPVQQANLNTNIYTDDLKINFNELEFEKKIGQGGYGVIYKATWNGFDVAVKALINSNEQEEMLKEIGMIKKLRHVNIIGIKGIAEVNSQFYLVMDFAYNGSVSDLIHASNFVPNIQTWFMIMTGMMAGLTYIHSKGITHRDIKPANLLVEGQIIKISDFGLAKENTGIANKATTKAIGTKEWMAPEQFNDEPKGPYSDRIDVYSAAMVAYEGATKKLPGSDYNIPGQDSFTSFLAFMNSRNTNQPENLSGSILASYAKLMNLVDGMWRRNPAERLSSAEVLRILKEEQANLSNSNSNSQVASNASNMAPQPINTGYVAPPSGTGLTSNMNQMAMNSGYVAPVSTSSGYMAPQQGMPSNAGLFGSQSNVQNRAVNVYGGSNVTYIGGGQNNNVNQSNNVNNPSSSQTHTRFGM